MANGARSIYFNGVPLMAQSGAYNFKGVTWDLRTGLSDQDPFIGFPAVESTFVIGVQVKTSTPQFHEVTNTDVTRCTVTMMFPALFVTDTKNGNTNPTSVHFSILVQPNGGVYEQVVDAVVNGKCTSTYEQSWTFAMPREGPWVIQVERLTANSTTINVQNDTYVSSVDEIVDHAIMYSDSAAIALTFDAQLFGSTIPSRTYDIQALIIQVPENYDPVGRTYATTGAGTSGGTWDGYTMKPAVTDNPAWIVFDLIQNNRYGMGIAAAAVEATKWDLYQIAQYCDQMIPDGITESGMEPRYTCNVCISSRDDAYRILQSFTSIFRGMSYWGSGTVRITADMPGPVVKLVNQTDVMDGNFAFAGTGLKARHSMAIASYIDPVNQWQPSPTVYQDQTQLNSLLGQNIAQIAAFGATSRGQAYRACKWLIDSEAHQYDTVTYTAGLDHVDIMPGEIIEIADPATMGLRLGGRIISAVQHPGSPGSTAVVIDGIVVTGVAALPASGTPDQLVDLLNGPNAGYYAWNAATASWAAASISTYAISIETAGTGIQIDQPVTSILDRGDGTNLVTISPALSGLPPAGGLWRMKNSVVQPREFRVIGISEPERGRAEVTALMHDPTKFARIEYGIDLTDTPYSALPDVYNDDIGPPSAIVITDAFVGEGTTTVLRTNVSWTPSTDGRVLTYDIEAGGDTGYSNLWAHLPGPSFDIDNLPVGNYVFGVRGVTAEGRQSVFALSVQVLINGQPIAPSAPLGLTAIGGTRLVTLNWQGVSIPNPFYYEVWRAPGASPSSAALLAQVGGTSYADTDHSVLLPLTTWAYFVRLVSTNLVAGPFAGPASATTTQLLVDDLANGILNTAKFAQGLAPIGLVQTGDPLPTTLAGAGGLSVILDENDSKLYRWNGVEFTAAVPAVDISGELASDQIASLNTDQLTGKIVAGQLDSASVLTENLAVGSPVNYIWNPCFTRTTGGWVASLFNASGAPNFYPAIGSSLSNFALQGFGSGVVSYTGTLPNNAGMAVFWEPTTAGSGVPVMPGAVYGGAAQIISNITVYLQIGWYDVYGNYISQTEGASVTHNDGYGGGLTNYARATVIGTAPLTAVTAVFAVVAQNETGAAQSTTFSLYVTQAMFGPMPPNATALGDWQPGGVTSIHGGVIEAESLNVNEAIIGTLDGDKLTEDSITSGILTAGAVTARELAAGAVNATNLAAEFALIDYEQVGHLTVNNLNIVGGAVSSFYSATANASTGGRIIDLTITTGANADGSSVTRSGIALIGVTVTQGADSSGSGNQAYSIDYGVNGSVVKTIYGSGGLTVDASVFFMVPISISTGSIEFSITFTRHSDAIALGQATFVVLVTSV